MHKKHKYINTRHVLPKIFKNKDNQAKKICQLIKYSMINNFLQRSCRKWARETSSRLLLFFKKAIYSLKASGQHLSFNIFW